MNNMLLSSDWHIDDYSRYNLIPGFRLEQFVKLAHRTVEIGKENNCRSLTLAGDLLNRSVNFPEVLHVLVEVLDILSKGFEDIYYVLGNHDISSKSNNHSKLNSVITAFTAKYSNIHYMHQKCIKLHNGKTMAFSNWMKDVSFEFTEVDKVDFFVGHSSFTMVFRGQYLDTSKFRIGFLGDIHNSGTKDNCYSINVPIQHNMGDERKGSMIVFDPDTESVKRVLTDPDNSKFLMMEYTTDKNSEGWITDTLYQVYKPNKISKSSDDDSSFELPEWDQINDLIKLVIEDKELSEIHQEVVSLTTEFNEVDFDFTIPYFRVKNYRSIDELELNLDSKEHVVIFGHNGSGKSSLLSALRDALRGNRYLKNNLRTGEEILELEIHIRQKGSLYKIIRGNHINSLHINAGTGDVEQHFNKKSDFDDKIFELLPFLHYMDAWFFDSDYNAILKNISSERRINLISKYYKLDRIEAYHLKARELDAPIRSEYTIKIREWNESKVVLDTLNNQLNDYLEVDTSRASHVESKLNHLSDLNRKYKKWTDWNTSNTDIISKLKFTQETLNSTRLKLLPESELSKTSVRISEINQRLPQLDSETSELDLKVTQLNSVTNKLNINNENGKKLKSEKDQLDLGNCPSCMKKLDEDKLKVMLDSMELKLTEMRAEYYRLSSEKNLLPSLEDIQSKKLIISNDRNSLMNEKNQLTPIITENTRLLKVISDTEVILTKISEDMKLIESNKPEEVLSIPENLSEDLINYSSESTKITSKLNLMKSISDQSDKVESLRLECDLNYMKVADYEKYLDITSSTGKIYEEVIGTLCTQWSDNSIIYEMNSGLYRKKPFLNIEVKYNVQGEWRYYDSLSSGQRIMADLNFMNNLFTKQGLLSFDENLKHLDDSNHELAMIELDKMNVNLVILTTHTANYSLYTKKILVELEDKVSKILIT